MLHNVCPICFRVHINSQFATKLAYREPTRPFSMLAQTPSSWYHTFNSHNSNVAHFIPLHPVSRGRLPLYIATTATFPLPSVVRIQHSHYGTRLEPPSNLPDDVVQISSQSPADQRLRSHGLSLVALHLAIQAYS
mmetsp:Transcript_12488/g.17067  ORF Transcript_12488/g.17067 Transcript_12488/m.17067 type:complete len:135 (+) Transcript_12488:241-645(+)